MKKLALVLALGISGCSGAGNNMPAISHIQSHIQSGIYSCLPGMVNDHIWWATTGKYLNNSFFAAVVPPPSCNKIMSVKEK